MCFPSMRCLLFSLDIGGRHLKDGSFEGFELGLVCAVLAAVSHWLRLDSIRLSSLGLGHL